MHIVFPRVIKANRGDIASRWMLIRRIKEIGIGQYRVFAELKDDVPPVAGEIIPYGKFKNFLPTLDGWKALMRAKAVFWGVGLDLQDDSSQLKLLYLVFLFFLYRVLGLKIYVLFQGAGPIGSKTGRFLAKHVLKQVDVFIARDPDTFKLVKSLNPKMKMYLGHDAIFLPGIEPDLESVGVDESLWINEILDHHQITVAFNLRQWFHFSSNILPYMFLQKKYKARSQAKMKRVIKQAVAIVDHLREKHNARILLLSAYQPNIEPWEDDLPWLRELKQEFLNDDEVVLIEKRLSMPGYYKLLSQLELVLGMRLHTTLIALRLGVPSINLSYTLKGNSILKHMHLDHHVVDLNAFLLDPNLLKDKIDFLLRNIESTKIDIKMNVANVLTENDAILNAFLEKYKINFCENSQ